MFGCGDSRVAAEIVFDRGLGDLFVVRTAGHVVDTSVLGSVEFALAQLEVPLVVVLGHDACGAVRASLEAMDSGRMPGGYLRDIVEKVTPSIVAARARGATDAHAVLVEHVRQTVAAPARPVDPGVRRRARAAASRSSARSTTSPTARSPPSTSSARSTRRPSEGP